MRISKLKLVLTSAALPLFLIGCGFSQTATMPSSSTTSSTVTNIAGTGTSSNGGGTGGIAVSNGNNVTGTGALTVPTAQAVVARITNGLQGNVSSTAGNFAKSLAQVNSNLPQVTNPLKATGYDQIQLLAYAACSDLTTGATPKMQSVYGVTAKNTVAASQAALVSAGMKILDQYTGSLASQGPSSAQVNSTFTNLVTQIGATATNTSTIAFVAVCTAAVVTGSTLLGF